MASKADRFKGAIDERKYPEWPEEYVADADFILKTSDNYEFHVNKPFLSEESDIFAALFASTAERGGRQMAELPDLTGDVLFEVLTYIYEEMVTDNFENVADQVLYAADKYNLAGLKDHCEEKMTFPISVDSVCTQIDLAKKFGLNKMLAECLLYIKQGQADPEMPWDQLAELFDGKILKEMVAVEYDDDEDN